MTDAAIALILGYALGSIPFAFIVTKAFGLGDIRQVGSGNVGTTNVLRTGNKLATALTFTGDVGKGIVAVLIARAWGENAAMAAALGAFTGHIFPVWLNFKGGKGLATCAGILAALTPVVALCAAATWLATAVITRISSLAALVTAVSVVANLRVVRNLHVVDTERGAIVLEHINALRMIDASATELRRAWPRPCAAWSARSKTRRGSACAWPKWAR
jgi:glycerol-3-phosphate acyltransferase PlsY